MESGIFDMEVVGLIRAINPLFLGDLFEERVINDSLRGELVKLAWFDENTHRLDSRLQPYESRTPQDGDFYAVLKMGKVLTKIAEEALAEYED